jgi:hypothetical protein
MEDDKNMQLGQSQQVAGSGIGGTLRALVDQEGTSGRSYVNGPSLVDGRTAMRNLADAVHYLCVLHGRHPGVIEIASQLAVEPIARDWMLQASEGFAIERSYLTRLAVAVGPQPSTPGQAESESSVNAQRHALETLSRSDRHGCALGTAVALVLDWQAVRQVLDRASMRMGLTPTRSQLPDTAASLALVEHVGVTPAAERAIGFGAQQLLAQHRGLWNLMEARHLARQDY